MSIRCANPACGHVSESAAACFCALCGATLPRPSAPEDSFVGREVGDGRYQILARLGEGGMGRVYHATQKLGMVSREVAFKTIRPELLRDPGMVERFWREVDLVSKLKHPNIVNVYDGGTLPDGTLFVAMEYVKGESLAQLIAAGRLPPARVELIVRQVASALAAAHGQGIVHRDLKPDNVILARPGIGADLVSKVVDFGIARQLGAGASALTRPGLFLGTPRYMAPEQFARGEATAASDLYALAMTTYEMLTGVVPFRAETPEAWMYAHTVAAPVPFEAHGPVEGLLPRHRDAVLRALAKSPSARFESVLEFAQAFTGDPAAGSGWTEGFSSAHGVPAPRSVSPMRASPPTAPAWGAASMSGLRVPPTVMVPLVPQVPQPPFPPQASWPPPVPPPLQPARGGRSEWPWIMGTLVLLVGLGAAAAIPLAERRRAPRTETAAPPPTLTVDASRVSPPSSPPLAPSPPSPPVAPLPATSPPPLPTPPPTTPSQPSSQEQARALARSIQAQAEVCLDLLRRLRDPAIDTHAVSIRDDVAQLAPTLAAHRNLSERYQRLREHAEGLLRASRCGHRCHDDQHHHAEEVARLAHEIDLGL